MTLIKKMTGIGAAVLLAIGLSACGSDKTSTDSDQSSNSSASVGKSVNYKITGIDPGAGLMQATEAVLKEYELDDWELVSGSGAAMTAALKKAYDKEKPIIITAWNPHWMFAKYDLKYLEDPKGVYGGAEDIHAIGRIGLKEDHPSAYQIFQQFKWTMEDISAIMVAIQDGEKPETAAQNWINENKDKVDKWVDGVEKVDGDKIQLAYVAWDDAIATHNMIKLVLEDMGYKVTLTQVEAGPMWTAIADGSADASLAAWLPVTHQAYNEKFKGKFEDIGINIEGLKIGLAVPTYMDIDSIEDLKK